jgi:hypothetical protein
MMLLNLELQDMNLDSLEVTPQSHEMSRFIIIDTRSLQANTAILVNSLVSVNRPVAPMSTQPPRVKSVVNLS